jgi:predicted dehydrogenase
LVIGVAVIGTGAISPQHIRGYLKFPDRCKIQALVDIFPERAREKAQMHSIQPSIVSDYHDLLDDASIQLVSIATPPGTHAQIAIDCLANGKHVLVEKPMAASLEECDAMIAAAAQAKRKLSVVAQNRFRTPMMNLYRVLESGLAGKILHAAVESYWWRGPQYYDLWWRGTWESEGGGVTLNHAVHHIDALQWMMGAPSTVYAKMANLAHDNAEVEDLSIALLTFGDGSLGQLTSSVVHHGQEQKLMFQGTRAAVGFPWQVRSESPKPNGFPTSNQDLEQEIQKRYESYQPLVFEHHLGQIDNVLTAIETDGSPLVDGRSGRRTLEIITGIYLSASTDSLVTFPLGPSSRFYRKSDLIESAPRFHVKRRNIQSFSENEITT